VTDRRLAVNLIGGVAAGLAATWLMGKATTYMYENEPIEVRRREDDARGGQTAFVVAARKIASSLGASLSQDQAARYGLAIHWAIGAGSGAVYALLRRRSNLRPVANALLFGVGLFAVMDEGVNYAFGLTPGPRAFPWQAHARGLAGHLVFGTATEATLDLINGIAA
jgi:hypothetical protein